MDYDTWKSTTPSDGKREMAWDRLGGMTDREIVMECLEYDLISQRIMDDLCEALAVYYCEDDR